MKLLLLIIKRENLCKRERTNLSYVILMIILVIKNLNSIFFFFSLPTFVWFMFKYFSSISKGSKVPLSSSFFKQKNNKILSLILADLLHINIYYIFNEKRRNQKSIKSNIFCLCRFIILIRFFFVSLT